MTKPTRTPDPGPGPGRYLLPVLIALITVGVPAQLHADAQRDIAQLNADARVRADAIDACRDPR